MGINFHYNVINGTVWQPDVWMKEIENMALPLYGFARGYDKNISKYKQKLDDFVYKWSYRDWETFQIS